MLQRIIPSIFLVSGLFLQVNAQTKNVLVEWYTSAKVPPSVRGMVVLDDLKTKYNIIEVGIHGGGPFEDGMSNQDAKDLQEKFGFNSIPSGMIDRTEVNSSDGLVAGVPAWENYVKTQAARTPLVDLDITNTYNSSTRKLDINVDIDFLKDLSKPSYVTVYLVEDSVIGSGTGYDQRNSLNNESGSPFYGKGDPILGFPHRHVLRKNVTGLTGHSFGSNISKGSNKNYSTSLTLPSAYDAEQISVVAFVSYLSSMALGNDVLNVAEEPVSTPYECEAEFSTQVDLLKVNFTNESNGDVDYVKWDFGDGSSSSDANPVHTYASAGTYSVQLITYAENNRKCSSEKKNITVTTIDCAPDFIYDNSSLYVKFISTSGKEAKLFSWKLGEGATSTLENPSYAYTEIKEYDVCLETFDSDNNSCGEKCKKVQSTSALDVYSPHVNSKVVVYPNPSLGQFHVVTVGNHQIGNYKVYSAMGTLVEEGDLRSAGGIVDLMNQPTGVYFLHFSGDETGMLSLVKL